MTVLETDRLIIEEFLPKDASFILELVNTESWLTYIGDKNIRTVEEATDYLKNNLLQAYERYGFGLCKVTLKENNEPIGMCGLIKRDTLEYVDIGFAFLPAYEGKGYGYESAKITVEYAFNKLGLPKLLAIVLENNSRSIKLLEKIGFQYEKQISINNETLCLYAQSNI